MKLFLDTEFTGLEQQSSLISIALVVDETRFFYAEFTDYDPAKLSVWHQENVIKNLVFFEKENFLDVSDNQIRMKGTILEIKYAMEKWFKTLPQIEIWADVLAYDWVLFCNIFGDAFSLPSNIYYIPFDMATVLKIKGLNPDISRKEFAFENEILFSNYIENYKTEGKTQHNALVDAVVLKAVYEKIFTT